MSRILVGNSFSEFNFHSTAAGNYASQTVNVYQNMAELTIIIWFRLFEFPATLMSNEDGNVAIRVTDEGEIDFHLSSEDEQ